MNAYTVSRLALDAGVSVHIVRDYLLRGLLRPVACTPGGYGLFDDAAWQRLCFVRAAFEAGIGLDALARDRGRRDESGHRGPHRRDPARPARGLLALPPAGDRARASRGASSRGAARPAPWARR